MAKPIPKLVPPDGGWGWMVVFGVAICNCTTQSLLSVYGLLFADTLQDMGVETKGAAIISNCMVAITNFVGLGIGVVMRRFSYRLVAMAGGFLVAIGMFFTSMATHMWHLLITYSILVGLGLGLLMPSTFVAVNAFFSESRGRAVGISLAGTGLGQMLMPHAVRFLLDEYGFRGCVLVLSAVALNSLPGAALFHPLRWHAKPAPAEPSTRELQPLTVPSRPGDAARNGSLPSTKKPETIKDSMQVPEECEPLTGVKHEKATLTEKTSPGTPQRSSNPPTPPIAPPPTPLRDVAVIGENLPALVDLKDNIDATKEGEKDQLQIQVTVPEKTKNRAVDKTSCWRRFVRLMDLDLLSDPLMLSLLSGLAAVYTAGVNFNMLFPFFLMTHVGLPRSDVALCMSFMAGFDISSRLLVPPFTDRLKVPARVTFLIGSLLLAASRSLMAMQTTLPWLLPTTALCGFVRGGTIVNLNLAISESCSAERLPGALGVNMVLKGISILVFGLFIGWLRDASGSFTLCIHLLSLVIVLPMLVWIVEMWQQRRKHSLNHSQTCVREDVPSSPQPPPYESPSSPATIVKEISSSPATDQR